MNVEVKNKGFSLVEVMVALLVLAVGILGISKLQGTLVRNSTDANQRAVATSLAQQKIDDLRSFALLTADVDSGTAGDESWTSASTWPAAQQSFAFIANDEGGTIAPATLGSPITVGNYAYSLRWDVADYYYNGLNTDASTANPSGGSIDFKRVDVTVAWIDEVGDTQSISLETVVDSYAPALTALSDNSSTGGTPPQASYTPELAPDVIDIGVDIGNHHYRQTSKPLPDSVQTGSDANVLVSFEVVTYHEILDELGAGTGEFVSDIQEEFVTVDCECTFSTSAGTALSPSHIAWDDDDEVRFDQAGSAVTKETASQSGNANAVDEVCSTCCRDHHDVTSTAISPVVRYDGQVSASGNHVHYKSNGSVADQSAGDTYVESCRFKRVDGILRVFQDWSLLDLTVMNRNNLVDNDPLQTQYTTYVDSLLKAHAEGTTLPAKPVLRTPINSAVGTIQQLESRGVYLDQVYNESGGVSTEYATYVADSSHLDRLEKIPFSEVNLTLLSLWSSASVAEVSVRNDAVASISDPDNDYYGTYSRGLITAHAEAVSPGANISSSIEPSNDGITQLNVNPSPATPVSDTVAIIVAAAATNVTVTGDLVLVDAPGGVKVTMNTPECTFDSGSDGPFTCSFVSGTNVDISITAYKKTTCEVPNGTFSQNNVTSTLDAGTITIDCSP